MRPLLLQLLCAVAVAACADASLQSVTGEVRLLPEGDLGFRRTFVGHAAQLEVTIANASRSPRPFRLRIDPPFELVGGVTEGTLEGGESRTIAVRLTPASLGELSADLVLETESGVDRRRVHAVPLIAPACASTACSDAELDPETVECRRTARPDGTSCGDACTPSGTCRGGTCVGANVACDDGNACTTDVCDPALGCQSVPLQCAKPEDPCRTSVCDPVTGCREVDVVDGTSCGRMDCDVADVCIAGRCVERAPPEGAVCGHPSPCQLQGRCRQHVCERPAAGLLSPEWVTPSVDGSGPVSDASGNFVQMNGYFGKLSSTSPDGVVRYQTRRPTVTFYNVVAGKLLRVHGYPLVFPGPENPATLSADDALTGTELWSRDLRPEIIGEIRPAEDVDRTVVELYAVFDAGHDEVGVVVGTRVVGWPDPGSPRGVWLLHLSPWTGRITLKRRLDEGAGGWLVADEDRNLYLTGTFSRPDGSSGFGLGSTDPRGALRWFETRTVPGQQWVLLRPEAVAHGRLVVEAQREWARYEYEVWDTATGALLALPGIQTTYGASSPVMDDRQLWLSGVPSGSPTEGPAEVILAAFDAQTIQERWRVQLAQRTDDVNRLSSELHLAQDGTVFAVITEGKCCTRSSRAVAFSRDGERLFECAFDRTVQHPGFLQDGHFLVNTGEGVASYRVGLSPAESGWLGWAGNPSRSFVPR